MGERRVWFKHAISTSTFESSFLGGRTLIVWFFISFVWQMVGSG